MDKDGEKRFVRRAVSVSLAIAVLLALALLLARAYWPELLLLRVSGLIASGRTDDALLLLDDVDTERVGQDAVNAQRYRAALKLEAQGREQEALALLDELADYANAGERALQTRYQQAERALDAGDLEAAAQAFYLLGDYRDAAARYRECMLTLHPTPSPTAVPSPTPIPAATPSPATVPTGTPSPAPTTVPADEAAADPAVALAAPGVSDAAPSTSASPVPTLATTPTPTPSPAPTQPPTPTPVPTTEAEGIATGQAQTPRGVLALGYRHTVGLLADGTVAAIGLNDAGQCDVDEWTNVVQVAAGAAHTLALRADGTAVATGDNQYGQCDVSQWSDLVQVAAGAYDSFGLCRDGTVVHCGWHEYEKLSKWHGLNRIAAGSYALIALHDGDALSTHSSMSLKGVFTDADAARGYAVGLCADGTLIGANVTLPDWRGIVAVSAGDGGILALDSQGCVHAKFFRSPAPAFPELDGRVIAVEAGAAHYALLMSDGWALCFGNDELGQCQTGNWVLRTEN